MGNPEITLATLDRGGSERFLPLRAALGVESFGINLIVLQPRQRGRVHDHERQEEVYLVLEGELTLITGDGEHLLERDQVARVPRGVRRQLVNKGPDKLVLLALGGYGEHQSRDGIAWESWEDSGPGRPPRDVPLPDDLP